MESIIRFDNVTKKYGQAIAVDNVNLEVKKGVIFAYIVVTMTGWIFFRNRDIYQR